MLLQMQWCGIRIEITHSAKIKREDNVFGFHLDPEVVNVCRLFSLIEAVKYSYVEPKFVTFLVTGTCNRGLFFDGC